MKKWIKLLLPILTLGGVIAVSTPFLVSCGYSGAEKKYMNFAFVWFKNGKPEKEVNGNQINYYVNLIKKDDLEKSYSINEAKQELKNSIIKQPYSKQININDSTNEGDLIIVDNIEYVIIRIDN